MRTINRNSMLGVSAAALLTAALAAPAAAHWQEVIAQSKEVLTVSEPVVSVVGHRLFVRKIVDAHHAVSVHDLNGRTYNSRL